MGEKYSNYSLAESLAQKTNPTRADIYAFRDLLSQLTPEERERIHMYDFLGRFTEPHLIDQAHTQLDPFLPKP